MNVIETALAGKLTRFQKELTEELQSILGYWLQFAPDVKRGGYYGRIDNHNHIDQRAPKGSVLHCRILWAFSAGYLHTGNPQYLDAARRAYDFISSYMIDQEHGGIFWTVDDEGKPLDTKKQVYAQAFAIYGLSQYYRASGDPQSLVLAKNIYQLIVDKSEDTGYGGYVEALSRDWKEMGDLRLSEKDANEKKSMNTHLHVLEGFANLYGVFPDEGLGGRIRSLIDIFLEQIIDLETGHLRLFFDMKWHCRSSLVSFGHDIEASWLLPDAAGCLREPDLEMKLKPVSGTLALAAMRGLDGDGGLWYEYEPLSHHLVREKHSWPQAESMVGYFNMWQLTGEPEFLEQSLKSWEFVKAHIRDCEGGEWFWGIYEDGSVMNQDKVGIWKCPYHNARACLEIISRIQKYLNGTI